MSEFNTLVESLKLGNHSMPDAYVCMIDGTWYVQITQRVFSYDDAMKLREWLNALQERSYELHTDAELCDLASTLETRLSAALGRVEWQPIETAPKDGTPLLGFMPSYYQGKGGQSVILWLHGDWMDNRAFVTKPTHWMPLPPPPSNQGALP